MFSNIMVEEDEKCLGVQWISKDMRKKHEKDIINFFDKHFLTIKEDFLIVLLFFKIHEI